MSSSSPESRPQPDRPEHGFREFISLRGPRGREFDENAQIRLFALCAKCRALEALLREFARRLANRYSSRIKDIITTEHYESTRLLRDPVDGGCHLCTLIWDSFVRHQQDRKGWDDAKHRGITLHLLKKGPNSYMISPRIVQTGLSVLYGEPIRITQPKRFALPPLTMSIATISTKSESCALFYTKCMEICDKTHTRCHVRRIELPPTRLLRVASTLSGTGTAHCVQLVSPGDKGLEFPKDTKFAALSYCWGKKRGLRLIESNYQSLTAGILFDQLPDTVQDAVIVTIKLGLQYLWVDALCIVQDSPKDWSYEAAKMCDVYQGCSIALVASGASNSGEGLYAVRDPLRQAPCLLLDTMIAQSDKEFWRQIEYPWALETRAWAMQEHLLPIRSIKFASYLIWECKELSINEFGLESQLDMDNSPREFSSLIIEPEETDPVNVPRIRKLWWLILEKYRDSKLSVKSDRLAAIAGLSSAIQRRTGWTFICGLWQPFLIQELLWYRLRDDFEPTGLRPSWSWASHDGGLSFIRDDEHIESTKVAEYIGTLPPMSGNVQSFSPSVLELTGVLGRAHKVRDNSQVLRVEGWPDSSQTYATYDQFRRPWTDGDLVLPLCVWDEHQIVQGLVVVPTEIPTTFERVGHFQTYINMWTPVDRGSHERDEFVKRRDEDMQHFLTSLKGSGAQPFVRRAILLR